jgi:hypothetical protein
MQNKSIRIIASMALCLSLGTTYAGAAMDMASEVYEPEDPKKKKAGEDCKSSDECQKHHACTKSGEKNLCIAPPRPKLPPGVVT